MAEKKPEYRDDPMVFTYSTYREDGKTIQGGRNAGSKYDQFVLYLNDTGLDPRGNACDARTGKQVDELIKALIPHRGQKAKLKLQTFDQQVPGTNRSFKSTRIIVAPVEERAVVGGAASAADTSAAIDKLEKNLG